MSLLIVEQKLKEITNASKENRDEAARFFIKNENLIARLFTVLFKVNDKISIKAAWTLEWICTHYGLKYILPHLNEFSSKIKLLKFDSSIRPCAKICEQIALANDKNEILMHKITEDQIYNIVDCGFNWLLTPQKIAIKAYTIGFLFLFGKKIEWIHEELAYLISTKIIHQSKGTKARGLRVLNQIEKHRNSHL